MKKIIKLLIVALLTGLILTDCKSPNKQESNAISKAHQAAPKAARALALAYPDESHLYLTEHEVEKKLAKSLIDSAKKYITYYNQTNFDTLITSIEAIHFDSLRSTVLSYSTSCGLVPTGNYLTALKIHFGIKNKKISLLFQPLLLCKNSQFYGPDYELLEDFTVTYKGPYYKYEPAGFRPTTDTSVLKTYLDSIMITKILNTNLPKRHNQIDYDITGDVRSLIFTFQEINAILTENTGASRLHVCNAIRKIPYGSDTLVKHSILLCTDNVHEKAIFSFYKKYGNLAHLCPPNCFTMNYRIIQ